MSQVGTSVPFSGYALRRVVVAVDLHALLGPLQGRWQLPLHLDSSARAFYDFGAPGDRLWTRQDVQDILTLYQDASAAMKTLAQEGKCWDTAEKEFKLPKYEKWPGYESGLPFVARRYCGLWGRGT